MLKMSLENEKNEKLLDKAVRRGAKMLDNDIKNLTIIIEYREKQGIRSEELRARVKSLKELKKRLLDDDDNESQRLVIKVVILYSYARIMLGIVGVLCVIVISKTYNSNIAKAMREISDTRVELKNAQSKVRTRLGITLSGQDDVVAAANAAKLKHEKAIEFESAVNGQVVKKLFLVISAILILTALVTFLTRYYIKYQADKITSDRNPRDLTPVIISGMRKAKRLLAY